MSGAAWFCGTRTLALNGSLREFAPPKIHDEISARPLGYETVLADGGASLSGGQRQRIALARAGRTAQGPDPRRGPSALDAITDRQIQHNLRRLWTTRIVAAHRLSTIRDADAIPVLERGRIVDSGTHDQLVARPGLYRELVAAQLDGAVAQRPLAEARSTGPREVLR